MKETSNLNIALLIDADNSPSKSIQIIFTELARHGKVNIRKAYGNWKSHLIKGWEEKLHEYAIQPIQQFDLTKGKNATDIAMTIDAMDILYTKKIDAFSIVTSDCDFTPLVTRIISEGKIVIGFGERKTPEAFVNACSTFLFLEELNLKTTKKTIVENLKKDHKLIDLVKNAFISCENEQGLAKLSQIGVHISNHASFDSRNYGYSRLSDLIVALDIFELQRDSNQHFIVKLKK